MSTKINLQGHLDLLDLRVSVERLGLLDLLVKPDLLDLEGPEERRVPRGLLDLAAKQAKEGKVGRPGHQDQTGKEARQVLLGPPDRVDLLARPGHKDLKENPALEDPLAPQVHLEPVGNQDLQGLLDLPDLQAPEVLQGPEEKMACPEKMAHPDRTAAEENAVC